MDCFVSSLVWDRKTRVLCHNLQQRTENIAAIPSTLSLPPSFSAKQSVAQEENCNKLKDKAIDSPVAVLTYSFARASSSSSCAGEQQQNKRNILYIRPFAEADRPTCRWRLRTLTNCPALMVAMTLLMGTRRIGGRGTDKSAQLANRSVMNWTGMKKGMRWRRTWMSRALSCSWRTASRTALDAASAVWTCAFKENAR